jgi:hypothetical protein
VPTTYLISPDAKIVAAHPERLVDEVLADLLSTHGD